MSNWSGWHTVIAVLGGIGAVTQYLSGHAADLHLTAGWLTAVQDIAQLDNVAMMVVGVLSGSALTSKGAS